MLTAASKKSRCFMTIFSILIMLTVLRLALPYALLHYVNYRLAQIPDYQATIRDLNVDLLQGRYVIHELALQKINRHIPVPFFSAKAISLAVEWKPLLHGRFVAQIDAVAPHLNFVVDPTGKDEQTSISAEWQSIVKTLFPLPFNRITLREGEAHLQNFKGEPTYDIYLKKIAATLDNLRNTSNSQQLLYATLAIRAETMDGAPINLSMSYNPSKNQPTFDMDASVNNMQVNAINDFLRYYTKVDIKQGLFSLYIEAAAKNSRITGYAKPLITNLRVVKPDEKADLVTKIYKGAVQTATKLLENPQQKTVATKINISGNINEPDVSIWSIISNILKNAFIQALLPKIDHTIEIKDVDLTSK